MLVYIEGLTDEMSRILRKFNIGVYTYPTEQLEIFYLK